MANQPQDAVRALMKAEQWTDAVAAAKQALANDPSNHELLWDLGWAHFKLEQYEDAAHYLHEAVDHGPVSIVTAALGATRSAARAYDAASCGCCGRLRYETPPSPGSRWRSCI